MKFLIKNLSLPFFLSLFFSKKKIITTEKNNNLTDFRYLLHFSSNFDPRNEEPRTSVSASNLSKTRGACQIIDFPSSLLQVRTCSRRSPACTGEEKSTGMKGTGMAGCESSRSNERENAVARPTSVLDPGQLILDGRVATFRFPETHGSPPRS